MYAIIETGGKPYKVNEGDVIYIEKLDLNEGDAVEFTSVKAVSIGNDFKVGAPNVEGAVVSGEIVKQTRGEKVVIFKKIRRHGYRRKKGHKQDLTVVKITDVKA